VSEPARSEFPPVDVRVGSTANALQPISSAERSLAAGPAQWLALVAVAGAAIVADQLTKQVVAARRRRRGADLTGPPDPSRRELRIAFGLFASRRPW
jgi:hypothetical protein